MRTSASRPWVSIVLCGCWLLSASVVHGEASGLRFSIESGVALPGADQQYSRLLLPTTAWTTAAGIAYRIVTWSPGGLPVSVSQPASLAELDLTLEVGHTRYQPLGVNYEHGGSSPYTMGPSTLITIIQGIQIGQSLEHNPRVTLVTGAGFTRVALSDLVHSASGNQIEGAREWTSAFMFGARVQNRLRSNLAFQLTARVVRIGGIQFGESLVMVPVTLGVSF